MLHKPISPKIVTDLVLNIIGWTEVFLLGVGWSRVATVFEDVPSEEEENTRRLRESLVKTEAYFKMRDKKLKVENELRFF